jgi:hypothetical protein
VKKKQGARRLRDVGDMGEAIVEAWAAEVGIVANRVRRDRTGWDLFLEFPSRHPSSRTIQTLDRTPDPLKCLVQVKSSDGRSGSVRLKLSNAQRMATTLLPTFVLVLRFDGQSQPVQAHLLHIDRTRVGEILKAIRSLGSRSGGASADDALLAKRRIPFRLLTIDTLEATNGEALKDKIIAHVGDDLASYTQSKISWLRTVGYEESVANLKVTVRKPDDERTMSEVLVDFALGVEKQLEVLGGELTDVRFGIPVPLQQEFDAATLRIGPQQPIGTATVFLRNEAGKEALFHGQLFVAGLSGAEEDANRIVKARVSSPYVTVILAPASAGKIDLRFQLPDGKEECLLADLAASARVVMLLADSRTEQRLTFSIVNQKSDWFTSEVSFPAYTDEEAISRCSAVVFAATVAKHFDLEQTVRVRTDELIRQREELKMMHDLLSEDLEGIPVHMNLSQFPVPDGKEVCAPVVLAARLADHVVILAGALFGFPSPHVDQGGPSRSTHAMSRKQFRIWRSLRFSREERPPTRNDLLENVASQLGAKCVVLPWWRPIDETTDDASARENSNTIATDESGTTPNSEAPT